MGAGCCTYLSTPVRLLLALGIGVFAFTGGVLIEAVQSWRNRHLWEGET